MTRAGGWGKRPNGTWFLCAQETNVHQKTIGQLLWTSWEGEMLERLEIRIFPSFSQRAFLEESLVYKYPDEQKN